MSITVVRPVHFRSRAHGRRVASTSPSPLARLPATRVPRISRLMALAIVLDRRLRAGEFESISEMARHFCVSQPRATQLLNLTLLTPDIIESLLFLSGSVSEQAALTEKALRGSAAIAAWDLQRRALTSILKG